MNLKIPYNKNILLKLSIILLAVIISLVVFEAGFTPASVLWRKICYLFNSGSDTYNVYVLGGSTAEGEPYYPKITFPKIIKYMFKGKINSKKIEIIKIARGGTNLEYNYWKLLKELTLRPKKNSMVLIYSGINDVTGKPPEKINRIWHYLQSSLIVSRLLYDISNTSFKIAENIKEINSLEKYSIVLEKIIRLAKSHDADIIISSLAGNISDFDTEVKFENCKQEAVLLFEPAKKHENNSEYDKALDIYKKAERICPCNYVNYKLGKMYQKLGDTRKAKYYLWKAVENYDARRPNVYQNELIRQLVTEYDTGYADTLSAFENYSVDGIPGDELFWDAHHPRLIGYMLMAKEFAKEISRLTKEDIKVPDPGKKEIMKHFDFTASDLCHVYTSRVFWFIVHNEYGNAPPMRYNKILEYLKKAEEIDPEDFEVLFYKFFIAAYEGDSDRALYWLNKGGLLTVFLDKTKDILDVEGWMLRKMPDEVANKVKEKVYNDK